MPKYSTEVLTVTIEGFEAQKRRINTQIAELRQMLDGSHTELTTKPEMPVAWAFNADKILGGPPWMELDRYDVIAKVPAEATPDTQRLMLQCF